MKPQIGQRYALDGYHGGPTGVNTWKCVRSVAGGWEFTHTAVAGQITYVDFGEEDKIHPTT